MMFELLPEYIGQGHFTLVYDFSRNTCRNLRHLYCSVPGQISLKNCTIVYELALYGETICFNFCTLHDGERYTLGNCEMPESNSSSGGNYQILGNQEICLFAAQRCAGKIFGIIAVIPEFFHGGEDNDAACSCTLHWNRAQYKQSRKQAAEQTFIHKAFHQNITCFKV